MTSPALLVLCLALVCSTTGFTSEGIANHDFSLKVQPINEDISHTDTKTANNTDLNMNSRRTNIVNSITFINNIDNKENIDNKAVNKNITIENTKEKRNVTKKIQYDELYIEDNSPVALNFALHKRNLKRFQDEKSQAHNVNSFNITFKKSNEEGEKRIRVRREDDAEKCEAFQFHKDKKYISHPRDKNNNNVYASNANCVTVINGTEREVIQLTFVDFFHIEYHPDCAYDYLEIRDGLKGYSKMLDKVCGKAFPRQITTSGPNVWLKFKSDETIEYEGFHINVKFLTGTDSHSIPESCYKEMGGSHGTIGSEDIPKDCLTLSANQALDVLWTIKTPENTKIYLNFTQYALEKPNECEDNVIQVFGYELEYQAKLAHYCGSVANSVTTKDGEGGKGQGNIMYVRMYASKAGRGSSFTATYTAFRTLDPNRDEHCDKDKEFDCEDNTCIDILLKCDSVAHCRLKADEEYETCKTETESIISQPHILVILVIFSLILSSMSFVFLFKCIRKLYQDHKIIKEHIKQSCEDRLDSLMDSRLTLDPKRLARDSEPRASLERENHTNEMFKQQRKFSQQKIRPTSIDSDFIHETRLDLEDEPWRRDVDRVPEPEEVRIERNGRTRKSDVSKKEESLRSKRESEEKKEIRDASVGAPDTKESGCQTRESLFQTETAPSSDGSGTTNSRGFSTFGYSGATIVRPSPPAPATNTSEITIELLRQVTPHPEKSQKKMSDRRPMSTETTRSAPDVIIVSKPIR